MIVAGVCTLLKFQTFLRQVAAVTYRSSDISDDEWLKLSMGRIHPVRLGHYKFTPGALVMGKYVSDDELSLSSISNKSTN